MVNWFKKANKRVVRFEGKVLEFYINLITGIIGGIIISFVSYYSLSLSFLKLLVFMLIIMPFWYFIGKKIVEHVLKATKLSKDKHLKNYRFSLLASIIGTTFVSFIAVFIGKPNFILAVIIATVILLIVFFPVIIFVVAKPAEIFPKEKFPKDN